MPRFFVSSPAPINQYFSSFIDRYGKVCRDKGTASLREFNLIILDCSQVPVSQFEEQADLAKSALDHDRPVLLLSPTAGHKAVLSNVGAFDSYIIGDTLALLISPRRDESGNLHTSLFELCGGITDSMHERTLLKWRDDGGLDSWRHELVAADVAYRQSLPNDVAATPFIECVKHAVHETYNDAPATIKSSDNPWYPPPEVPSNLYSVTPINLFSNWDNKGVQLQALVTVAVYYDNMSFNTPVQWLSISHDGMFSTTLMSNSNDDIKYTLYARLT